MVGTLPDAGNNTRVYKTPAFIKMYSYIQSNLIFKYNQPITKPKQGSQCITNRENCLS